MGGGEVEVRDGYECGEEMSGIDVIHTHDTRERNDTVLRTKAAPDSCRLT